jgi:hypothetical protein
MLKKGSMVVEAGEQEAGQVEAAAVVIGVVESIGSVIGDEICKSRCCRTLCR